MAERRAAETFAKVNLGLVVRRRAADGYHPLVSLAQSVSWADRLDMAPSPEDRFTAEGMDDSRDNLAWQAVEAVRSAAGARRAVGLALHKRIPVAAGLGGGSADAAAALVLAAGLFGLDGARLPELAVGLGADVPFCLTGGLAILEGRGDRIQAQPPAGGYALGIVVAAFELSTPAVYRQWDLLDGPQGDPFPAPSLPPALRQFDPLRNDLQPAAERLAPGLGDWRADLARRWGRPVAMTGSGPSLFGFFVDEEEAAEAVNDVPAGTRAARAAVPTPRGWRMLPGTLADPE